MRHQRESVLPMGIKRVITMFTSWIASPLAFQYRVRHRRFASAQVRAAHPPPVAAALPFLTAAPVFASLLPDVRTVHSLRQRTLAPLVAWDATHPTMFFTAFAIGLSGRTWGGDVRLRLALKLARTRWSGVGVSI